MAHAGGRTGRRREEPGRRAPEAPAELEAAGVEVRYLLQQRMALPVTVCNLRLTDDVQNGITG